ncbi:unnamed protein product [Toxocara canis]|nr:unnamed protein product [Toxocara canis]
MTADDAAALDDYNKKVQNWKFNLRDTILAALPFRVQPGQPIGFSEWPFGSASNPFDSFKMSRKRRDIGRFPDAPSFCDPDK